MFRCDPKILESNLLHEFDGFVRSICGTSRMENMEEERLVGGSNFFQV